MSKKFQKEIEAHIKRADESIEAARELLKNNHYDFSASRSYYAAFYVSSALLLSEELEFGKHSGVLAAIHQKFIKSGKIEKNFGKDLNWLFELRSVGDYGVIIHVGKDEAKEAIKIAENYVTVIKQLISNVSST